MARALIVLAWAAAAAATRYADYAGGKMPQYGAGSDYDAVGEPAPHSDDYHGHSPDAPASLDYKYEEERRSKTDKPSKTFDDADVWRKVRRKQRGLQRPEENADMDSTEFNEDDDEVPRARSSRVHAKRRPRLKSADDARPPAHRRSAKYNRDRKIEVSDTRDIDRDDTLDDKSNAFEDDVNFPRRDTTRRVNCRKPRERDFDDDLETDEQIVVADRRMKNDDDKDSEYPTVGAGRRRQFDEHGLRERYRPVLEDGDPKIRPTKQRQKIYDNYNDYYDMKRVNSIKQHLPSLLRRTTTVKSPSKPGGTELMHALWPNRRLGVKPSAPSMPKDSDSESDSGEIGDIRAANFLTQTSITPSVTTVTTQPPITTQPTVTTVANTAGTIISSPSTTVASANTSQEMSLAEKSRLSILKKAQRKFGVKDMSTKKPPVLLQVTQKLATVIMVEPPVSRQPWLAPHMLTGDSPGRIDRVKRLMRHKLVAQAKSIQDLTDNWDDMVCDYIDVALLNENGAPAPFSTSFFYVAFISFNILMRLALS